LHIITGAYEGLVVALGLWALAYYLLERRTPSTT